MKLSKKQKDQLGWIAENCEDDHAKENNNHCAYCECATMAGCKPYSARTLLSLRKHGLIQIWDVNHDHFNSGNAWVQLTEDNCRHIEGNGVYFCRTTPKYDELFKKEKKPGKMTINLPDNDGKSVLLWGARDVFEEDRFFKERVIMNISNISKWLEKLTTRYPEFSGKVVRRLPQAEMEND